ncbi:hypothetical protein R3P38DRAFT_3168445 [Favolaschia claudopus]|uniref:DUF429 domain-containing protein n=1 Tax=Favolaschia claudopus TaxID=2862362 RepID=A0AAW0E7C2_9AGAR
MASSRQAVGIDFLTNRNTSAALGPFDGRVAALCTFEDTDYLLTTHADYVPTLPASRQHNLFLRADLRYGPDDFTRWPQQYSPEYCHLPCVRTKTGSPPELSILWQDPSTKNFVKPADDSTLTPGLGRLDDGFRSALEQVVEKLRMEHALYVGVTPAGKVPPPLGTLAVSLDAALERLQTIPLTYDQLVLSVTHLQLTWLEFDAMLQYMAVYKPQIEAPFGSRPELAACVGAFTADARVAQFLHKAGLPYWYLRPAKRFDRENILELVRPLQPSAFVCLDPHARETAVSPADNNTAHKIAIIHKHSMIKPWYEDPFDLVASHPAPASSSVNTRATHVPHRGGLNRYTPYSASNPSRSNKATNQGPKPPAGRDKYIALDRPEMPPTIPSWENALKQVDRNHYPLSQRSNRDTYYVFPEPALLASPEDPALRQQRLFHFELMKDALTYRISHTSAAEGGLLLSSQQWRDVLAGRVAAHSGKATKTQRRIDDIERVLQPALSACGLDGHRHLPVDPRDVPAITIPRAREIIWSVAEMGFRFELLSLDHRASGLNRGVACRACFPSPRLLEIPLDNSKRGFASSTVQDRHPYSLRLARLMLDWKDVPRAIRELAQQSEWSAEDMSTLEEAVTGFYCQQFYEHFGRAAVVPLRIEHEFES